MQKLIRSNGKHRRNINEIVYGIFKNHERDTHHLHHVVVRQRMEETVNDRLNCVVHDNTDTEICNENMA